MKLIEFKIRCFKELTTGILIDNGTLVIELINQ